MNSQDTPPSAMELAILRNEPLSARESIPVSLPLPPHGSPEDI
jgi:hypothetical protein